MEGFKKLMTNNFKLLRCILFSRLAGPWDHSDGSSNDYGLLSQLPLNSNRQSWIAFHLEPSFLFLFAEIVSNCLFLCDTIWSLYMVFYFTKWLDALSEMCWSTPDGITNLVSTDHDNRLWPSHRRDMAQVPSGILRMTLDTNVTINVLPW